jgi:hypothetical protein
MRVTVLRQPRKRGSRAVCRADYGISWPQATGACEVRSNCNLSDWVILSRLTACAPERAATLDVGVFLGTPLREAPLGSLLARLYRSLETSDELATWDVSAVTSEEMAAVRRFLQRRDDLPAEARERIAGQLNAGLRPKVAGLIENYPPETFLERLAAAKSSR